MTLLIVSIVLSVIAVFSVLLIAAYKISNKGWSKASLLLSPLGIIFMILLLFGSFTKIAANEVGIIYHDKNGVQDEVKYEGFQSKSIFEHITKINTTNKTMSIGTTGQTIDAVYATVEITVIYKIEAVNAGKFFKITSSIDISKEQMNSIVKECLQSSTIKYDIYQLLGEELETARLDFVDDLTDKLLERYHITLVSASFDDVDAGERVEEIIKTKAEAQQKIEIAEQEKKQAQVEAQTLAIRAEADAEVAKIKAQADAEVVKLGADAEAYKVEIEKTAITSLVDVLYEKYNSTLTYKECADIVLQTVFFEKWDGKLPEVLTSDSLSSLIGSLIK